MEPGAPSPHTHTPPHSASCRTSLTSFPLPLVCVKGLKFKALHKPAGASHPPAFHIPSFVLITQLPLPQWPLAHFIQLRCSPCFSPNWKVLPNPVVALPCLRTSLPNIQLLDPLLLETSIALSFFRPFLVCVCVCIILKKFLLLVHYYFMQQNPELSLITYVTLDKLISFFTP